MFETASRLKLRFDTSKGQLSVEDLWDLPLVSSTSKVSLDEVAKDQFKKLKAGNDVSFVVKEQKTDDVTQLKFDIVKHIIDVRLKENEAASLARSNKEKRQKILDIIEQKENAALSESSIDDLKKMLESV